MKSVAQGAARLGKAASVVVVACSVALLAQWCVLLVLECGGGRG